MLIIDKLIKLCEKEEKKEVEISKDKFCQLCKDLMINFAQVDYSPDDLLEGTKVEFREHTDVHHGNLEIAMDIAMDHLNETKDYYKKLKEANL